MPLIESFYEVGMIITTNKFTYLFLPIRINYSKLNSDKIFISSFE